MGTIDASSVNFEVDPMMTHKVQLEMQKNPEYAQMLNTNITDKIFQYIQYKIKMRENINFAFKGECHLYSLFHLHN